MLAFVFSFAALSLRFHWQHSRVQRRILKLPTIAGRNEGRVDHSEDALAEDTAALEDITQDRQAKSR